MNVLIHVGVARAFVFLLVIGLLSCSTPPKVFKTHPTPIKGSLGNKPIEHVVIFAIDGLMRDTLLTYLRQTPPQKGGGFHDLLGAKKQGNGIVFTQAIGVNHGVTVFPSYTYPAWTSMFTGVYPGAHGITGNSVFFRERGTTRYYAEYHLDALRV